MTVAASDLRCCPWGGAWRCLGACGCHSDRLCRRCRRHPHWFQRPRRISCASSTLKVATATATTSTSGQQYRSCGKRQHQPATRNKSVVVVV